MEIARSKDVAGRGSGGKNGEEMKIVKWSGIKNEMSGGMEREDKIEIICM